MHINDLIDKYGVNYNTLRHIIRQYSDFGRTNVRNFKINKSFLKNNVESEDNMSEDYEEPVKDRMEDFLFDGNPQPQKNKVIKDLKEIKYSRIIESIK